MGRRNARRHDANFTSRRSGDGELVQADSHTDFLYQPQNAQPKLTPIQDICDNAAARLQTTPLDRGEDLTAIKRSLHKRELKLVAREADLQSRRRQAAREIRQQRRESNNLDLRLAEIESLMAELAQAVLQSNAVLQEHSLVNQRPACELSDHTSASTDDTCHSNAIELDRQIHNELIAEVQSLRDQIETLKMQNDQLAGDVAQSNVRRSIVASSDGDAALSWEERKAMLFAQDQEYDLPGSDGTQIEELNQLTDRLRQELEIRNAEIGQLRELLEQRPAVVEDGMAVGAAAIAQMMDSDELIVEERQRLQDLQIEWESKFREMEIAASIERASLARERQQLERKNVELEEQLAHLKHDLRQEEIAGPNQSRRWLAKLGLAD